MNKTALHATILGLVAFATYVSALPPSFAFWDTGELQTVAIILGIAHPPACPAFILLGWLVAHVVPFGEAAWRVDLMCATAVAVAVGVLYAVARRFEVPPIVAAICTLGFAFANVTLHDATRAEVQDLSLLFRTLAIFFAIRFYDGGSPRTLFATALVTGLAGATHGIALLLVPSIAIVVLARPDGRSLRSGAIVAFGVGLGLLPYAYLPLRSAYVAAHALDPTIALGLAAGASAFWDYDHPATIANFIRVLTASDFNVHSGFAGFFDIARYPAFAGAFDARAGAAYGPPGTALAAVGFALALWSRKPIAIALVLAAVAPVPYTESYTELQDPDRYYLFPLWCAAIAIGLAYERIAELLVARPHSIARTAMTLGLVVSFVAAAPARLEIFAQRNDRGAARYVADFKRLVPDGSIVLAEWAYATPLAYAAYVNHDLGARVVVAASPEQYVAHYARWLRARPIYIVSFDDALALPGYRCRALKRSPYAVYSITSDRAHS